MQFASLGSGSRGNATLVEAGSTLVMVDCGFSCRETERRMARLDRSPEQLSAVLVTHEHHDHCSPEDVAKVSGPATVVVCNAGSGSELPGAKTVRPGDRLLAAGVEI